MSIATSSRRARIGIAAVGIAIALVAVATARTFGSRHAAAPASATAAPEVKASVQTVPVRQGPIAPTIQAYGSIDFAGSELATLSLPYAAQLTRLSASNGQPVRAGTVLAEMTADPAVAAAYVQATSTVKAAQDELRRTQALFREQLATQSQLAAAQKAVTDADATLAELQRQGASPGPRALTAPFDAVVMNVAAAQGDRLAAGAPIMQLGRRGSTGAGHVSLGVDPSLAALVRVGAPVRVSPLNARAANAANANAGADTNAGADPAFAGHVIAVRQAVNAQTRLVDTSVALDPSAGTTRLPGTAVGAQIELAPSVHWIVPRTALLTDASGAFVYQVANGHAHRVGVTRQVESGSLYGVDGALAADAPVVVVGNYELADGMAVVEAAR